MSDFQDNLKDKIREIKQNPGRAFGLLYPYIFIVILILGLIYISNLGEIARQTIPPSLPDTTSPKQLKIEEPRTVAAVNVMELSEPPAVQMAPRSDRSAERETYSVQSARDAGRVINPRSPVASDDLRLYRPGQATASMAAGGETCVPFGPF